MLGLAFLALSFVVAIALRRAPILLMLAIIAAFVAVPGPAVGRVLPFLPPGVYLQIAALLVLLVTDRDTLSAAFRRTKWVMWPVLALSVWASLDLLNGAGLIGFGFFVVTILIAPYILYVMIRWALTVTENGEQQLVIGMIGIALAEGALAYVQVSTQGRQGYIWRTYYEEAWFWTDNWNIGMGTTGHSLQYSLFLAAVIPLVARLKSIALRYALAALLFYGVTLGFARTAIILSGVAAASVVLGGVRLIGRTLAVAILSLPIIQILLSSASLARVLGKFREDQGSAQLRADAWRWAWEHHDEFLYFGYPGARDLRTTGVTDSSLENAYLMAGLQFGLVFAALLLLVHLSWLTVPLLRRGRSTFPYFLATAITMIGFNGSSSFMARGLEGTTMWVFLAMYHWAAYERVVPTEPSADEQTPDSPDEEAIALNRAPADLSPSELLTAVTQSRSGH